MKHVLSIYLISFALFLACNTANSNQEEEEVEEVEDEELYFQQGEVERVYFDPENTMNIVFLGENYIKSDLLREDGLYRKNATEDFENILSSPPFNTFKDEFNLFVVYAANNENGTTFNYSGGSSSSIDFNKIEEYVTNATGIEAFDQRNLILFSNKNIQGSARAGNKIAIYRSYSSPETKLHEVGHAFALLGDEYQYGVERDLELLETGDAFNNLDITDDSTKIKWKHFFEIPGYEDVGIFEGGYYRDSLVYRPTLNSIMRTTNQPELNLGFNAPSREILVKEIFRLTGRTYTFDQFLEIDRPNIR